MTLGEEIRDRFGPMPPEAEQLLFAIRIKMKAGPAGISEIFMDEKTLVVRLLAGLMPRRPRLTSLFGRAVTFTASSIRLNLPALKGDWMTALEQVVEVTAA